MTELHWMSVAELNRAYAQKKLSPVEVTRHLLDRVDTLNPRLNAFYLVAHDSALADARKSEERWRRGAPLGPFDGVPSSVKDALGAIGWPAYRGSLAHSAEIGKWDSDAPAIARMREAGAILLGKTTMPDFGILASGYSSKHGITRNPWKLRLNTGGSSSGAGAAIAAGLHPAAIGTDIVGSVRLPASFCGLFGLKPHQGRVPYYPPNNPALAAGPMTRTVEDAALLMNIVTLPDARDFTALPPEKIDYRLGLENPIKGTRLGVVMDLGFGLKPDLEVQRLCAEAIKVLEKEGCTTVPIDLSFSADDLRMAEDYYRTRCYAEFMTFAPERREAATVIRDWTRPTQSLSARALYEAMNGMRRMREKTVRSGDNVDFIVLPSVHIPPFAAEAPAPNIAAPFEPWCNTFLFNLTEQPASSVPCGRTAAGAPVGLQIVGRRFDDVGVMRMSRAYERAVGGFPHPDFPGNAG